MLLRTQDRCTPPWRSRQREYLLQAGLATQAELDRIAADIAREMEEGVLFAMNSPDPDPSELFTDVYSN